MATPLFNAGTLPDRAIFRVAGPDARTFLQGLLTIDVTGLAGGRGAYGALLTPQGKILFDLFILAREEGFLIDCARAQRDELMRKLAFYRLRAKVEIEAAPQAVAVFPEEPPQPLRYPDPRLASLGWRALVEPGSMAPASSYGAAQIALGLADSADLAPGEFFPHEANMDQFGGVDFGKGCYVGQEVVSRMEHRGTARSRIVPVVLSGAAPARGTAILAGGKQVGTLLSAAGNRALALLRLDRLAEAQGPLLTEHVSLAVRKPSFARYEVAGATEDSGS
ncbi:MAG: folate-binding protein YgfZ [Alphaproteobacteria bacterium]|nr:folate-binding protein YgfZ [Alphaproteobacteria bacterium]